MANEIIVMERSNGKYSFHFMYPIPVADRIEIGGTGTTGAYPVLTPAPTEGTLSLVLTQAEKDAMDAGEAVLKAQTLPIPDGATDAEVLAIARGAYEDFAPGALADYKRRYKYIGRRFDKE